jgi:hypothetical protein
VYCLAVTDTLGPTEKFSSVQGADGDNDIILYAYVDENEEPAIGHTSGCQTWTITGTPIGFTSTGNIPLGILVNKPGLFSGGAHRYRVSEVNSDGDSEVPDGLVHGTSLHASCSCDTYWGCEPTISTLVDNTTDSDGVNYMMGPTAELYGTAPAYATALVDDDHGCANYWVCSAEGGCESALSILSPDGLNVPDTKTQAECDVICSVSGDPHVTTFFGEKYDM